MQRKLEKLNDALKSELNELRKEATAVAICLDIWSSKRIRGYLGVTVHFVDKAGNLRSCVLGCPSFTGSHDAQSICELAIEVIEEYGIREKIVYIHTDNAANMIAAFRDLNPGLEERNLSVIDLDGRFAK